VINSLGSGAAAPLRLCGGPYNGRPCHRFATQGTLVFTAKGQSGYYNAAGNWIPVPTTQQVPAQ
jgi:hypothetical protein